MENLNDLFNSELKNLYALEKQFAKVLNEIKDNVADEDLLQIITDLTTEAEEQFDLVHQALKDLMINPGSTTDSVVQQMAENLRQASLMDIPQEVKDEGILASLNRLNYYRMACYENTYELAKKLGHKELKEILEIYSE
ncbi:MAG: DUF892 family protein [Petrimonas sp.]|nr:DUF892 family protein [Petrimonas sp.]